ncbi:hypothetical protein OBBRIDRAFT_225713 [Obba rivulosa]|uniref:Uncharacterized protein n=1 Tax=Obba rivulosa TaxID=1052685 RepID=A0A8E2DGY8_9APHY|nr:hypothetical protein OBBRIDRAFT_225713 [Obba rivulosa]
MSGSDMKHVGDVMRAGGLRSVVRSNLAVYGKELRCLHRCGDSQVLVNRRICTAPLSVYYAPQMRNASHRSTQASVAETPFPPGPEQCHRRLRRTQGNLAPFISANTILFLITFTVRERRCLFMQQALNGCYATGDSTRPILRRFHSAYISGSVAI